MNKWLWMVVAIISEVVATLSLKAALNQPMLYIVIVLGYVAAFSALSQALKMGMHLGVAYGVWGSAGVALTAIFAHLIFAEPLTITMWAGIVLIIFGVLCVELGAQKAKVRGHSKLMGYSTDG